MRKERNLNQKDMASVANLNKDAYGRKERGESQFRLDEMFLISEFLDKPMDEIFLPRKCIKNATPEKNT